MFPQPAFVGSRFVFQWFSGLQSCSVNIHSLAASIAQRRLEGHEGVTKATIPVVPSRCRAPLVDGRREEQLPCVPEMALDKGKLSRCAPDALLVACGLHCWLGAFHRPTLRDMA